MYKYVICMIVKYYLRHPNTMMGVSNHYIPRMTFRCPSDAPRMAFPREFPRLCPWPLPATFAGEANSCITTILGPMGTMTQLQDCELVEPSDIGFDPGISMYCLQHEAQTLETKYVSKIYMMPSGCFMRNKKRWPVLSAC